MNPQHVQKLPPVRIGRQKQLARIAAGLATSGRLAHQTWRRLGAGNGVMGVRSRRLSMPIFAIGNHSSISRRGRLLACSMVRFIRSSSVKSSWERVSPCWIRRLSPAYSLGYSRTREPSGPRTTA